MRACVRACVRACGVCVCVCVCLGEEGGVSLALLCIFLFSFLFLLAVLSLLGFVITLFLCCHRHVVCCQIETCDYLYERVYRESMEPHNYVEQYNMVAI